MISAAASAAMTAGRLSFTAAPPMGQTRPSKSSGRPISRVSQLRKVARFVFEPILCREADAELRATAFTASFENLNGRRPTDIVDARPTDESQGSGRSNRLETAHTPLRGHRRR